MMITLVTGATGLVGNNMVRHLLSTGGSVRVLARSTRRARPFADLPELDVVQGDVRDRTAVERAVSGVQRVVHAAAHVHIGWTGLDVSRAVNVEGTRSIAQAARRHGAEMVHVSSIDALAASVRGELVDEATPITGGVECPYVITKREAEAIILEEVDLGLRAMIVNPGFMIGPYDWKPSSGQMLLTVARGWGLWVPRGANCFCDVRDVAAGIQSAFERGQTGRRYILAGPSRSYRQAWRIFAQATGGTPPVFPIGPLLAWISGRVGDAMGKIVGREPVVNSAAVRIAAQRRQFSSQRAETELGYRTRPLEESAADAWAWFRANGYV